MTYRDRIQRLTQRLDHMVPERHLSDEENARASQELVSISEKLQRLLPDPSLSPDDRLERFVRVSAAQPKDEYLESAHVKVERLKARLTEMVPEGDLTPEDRIDRLVQMVSERASTDRDASMQQQLEEIGDPRVPAK